ncbi:unnamed protein product [Pelagomonas calceolata]|uniref:Uncharacterized protein n=1 Tax=Pelagomonas calceolata TaxID=35677 RepID=A0A7S3ZSX3_9STRA|nr:unnamed protein product [Pelagomonas calceolata]
MGKKKGKKGKKQPTEAELAAAALAAEEAAKAKAAEEAEAIAYKERVERLKESIRAKEEDLARRETDVDAAEINWKKKLEGLDAEVTLRARSGIAAAEAREAATARLAVMREDQAMKRLSVFAEAESKMAVREVEVSAREEAMEARVNGGVAEHLDTMLAAQADTRDVMEARRKEIASQLGELDTIEKSWRDTVLKKEAELAQREREARGRVAAYEKKLLERDFTLKRRLMRDIRKVYNKVVGQEEECAVRDRRMAAREAEVTQRGKDVEKMVKDARSYERRAKKAAAGATKVVKDEDAPWETSALAATAADKPRPYAARNLPPKKPPTPEPDFDPETEFFLTEAANLDPAVDATPDLPPGIDATPDASWAPNMTSAQKPAPAAAPVSAPLSA